MIVSYNEEPRRIANGWRAIHERRGHFHRLITNRFKEDKTYTHIPMMLLLDVNGLVWVYIVLFGMLRRRVIC